MHSMGPSHGYVMTLGTMFALGLWLASPGIVGSSFGEEQMVVKLDGGEKSVRDLTNEELQAFAKAQVKVAKIQTSSVKKDGSKTIDLNVPVEELPEGQKVSTIQAIEAQGLTVSAYNQLMKAYKADEDFRSEVVRAILNLH
jgi:hypothetical protein